MKPDGRQSQKRNFDFIKHLPKRLMIIPIFYSKHKTINSNAKMLF